MVTDVENTLREEIAALKAENQAQARQIEELRVALAALLAPTGPDAVSQPVSPLRPFGGDVGK